MAIQARGAPRAGAASGVDLAGHTPSVDLAHELVAGHAAEAHVAAGDLEIGVADAGQPHADERFARARLGNGVRLNQMQPLRPYN
jgi:dihydroxyacetone kinase